MKYALVKNGEIIEYRNYEPVGDQTKLVAGKPRMLPLEVVDPEYDPVTHVKEGPTIKIEKDRVVRQFKVRAKDDGEIAAMIEDKEAEIEREFEQRCNRSVSFPVGGIEYKWHTDPDSVTNIMGVILMIIAGVPVPDPRPWTPKGSRVPVALTHAELIGLGAAIASRKDALFVVKKAKQAEVAALNGPKAIANYDVSKGWP